MNQGWVKLHRKFLNNELLRVDVSARSVFITLLLLCDKRTGTGTFGRELLGYYSGLKPITAYKAFLRLKKAKMVTQSSNNRFTAFSICKWEEYQAGGNKLGNNQVTTKEQPSNTLQEVRSKNIFTNVNIKGVFSKELLDALGDFAEFRKKQRKPLTEKAATLIVNKLDRLYPDNDELKIRCLEQSIENGWSGIFELNDVKKKAEAIW